METWSEEGGGVFNQYVPNDESRKDFMEADSAERISIECSGCYDTLNHSAEECPSGHLFCDLCRNHGSCSECGERLKVSRDIQKLWGDVASLFPCRYHFNGCPEKFCLYQQNSHEVACRYRPLECPFCEWCGTNPKPHLEQSHGIKATVCPFNTELEWTFILDNHYQDNDATMKTEEEAMSSSEGGDATQRTQEDGRRWSILLGCQEGSKQQWFLLSAEQESTGDVSCQLQSLNYQGDYIGTMQYKSGETFKAESPDLTWAWKIPTLRGKKQRVIIPQQVIQTQAWTQQRTITLFVSIQFLQKEEDSSTSVRKKE